MFRPNTPESILDAMRSIIATYKFRHQVMDLKAQGVDFSTYMYVPEIDPVTNTVHHERADHGHLLKRMACKFIIITTFNLQSGVNFFRKFFCFNVLW